jgi:hypothetical protein
LSFLVERLELNGCLEGSRLSVGSLAISLEQPLSRLALVEVRFALLFSVMVDTHHLVVLGLVAKLGVLSQHLDLGSVKSPAAHQ